MKTTKTIIAIATATVLTAGMLSGCAGAKADAEAAPMEADHTASLNTYVADDVEMDVMLHEAAAAVEELAPEAVVEVVDESGNTVQMTAAEAKASGKQIVSDGSSAPAVTNQSSSAPAASAPSAPSAPSHQHSWAPITSQKYVVDKNGYDTIICSCGQSFSSTSAWGAHSKDAGRGSTHSYSVKTTPEQGHYETITTGYSCSCGATK